MFGKRQTFGGNTPGASQPPKPQASPTSAPGGGGLAPQQRIGEMVPKAVVDAAA